MIKRCNAVWILSAAVIGAALLLPSSSAWAAQAAGTATTAAAGANAAAAGATQGLTLDLTGGGVMTERLMQIVGLVTILSLAPSILIMMTCFTRIVVVLSLLRTAIGIQQSPPNSVIVSLALFLTFFVMAPTFNDIYQNAMQPLIQQQITTDEAFTRASSPIKKFMAGHTRNEDLALFVDMAAAPRPATVEAAPLQAIVPAFMLSELKRAFEIGFLIFVPFLVIDMAVASILMSMGMMMLPPIVISLPFKLIFFVLVDGWRLVAGSLVASYGVGIPGQ
ncbi:MAG TPA: flagellar type III secretion system pore protein FliP [Micropepsaceae bacterium]|jgi:flagellar biosynthetic protein FliP|nr:flagellar type III secretion system pore protein FliP [Micropepsaceae bacterium]